LKLSNAEETDDPKTILEEEKTFYKNLYSVRNVNPNNSEFDAFFNNNLSTPLNEDQSKKCGGLLTEQERYQALKEWTVVKTRARMASHANFTNSSAITLNKRLWQA